MNYRGVASIFWRSGHGGNQIILLSMHEFQSRVLRNWSSCTSFQNWTSLFSLCPFPSRPYPKYVMGFETIDRWDAERQMIALKGGILTQVLLVYSSSSVSLNVDLEFRNIFKSTCHESAFVEMWPKTANRKKWHLPVSGIVYDTVEIKCNGREKVSIRHMDGQLCLASVASLVMIGG
jgi:hypothetical protein